MVDAVLDLAAVAVVLTLHTGGLAAALGGAGIIDHANRRRVRVLAGHQLLAAVAEPLLVPGDGLQKTLQCPRRNLLIQRHRLDILSLHVAEQSADIDCQQSPARRTTKATCEQRQKLGKQFSQCCDILNRHRTTLRGFRVKQKAHGGSFLFALEVNGNKAPPINNLTTDSQHNLALSN
jgi:hypothetical protein